CQACRTSGRQGSPALHDRVTAPNGSQKHIPRPAYGSSVPDRSTGAPSTNSEVQVRREARTDREQHRSSAPDDLQEPRRQVETRRTVDLGHSSNGPSWVDLAAIRVNKTESRFAASLNRLLQQNLPMNDTKSPCRFQLVASPKAVTSSSSACARAGGQARSSKGPATKITVLPAIENWPLPPL